MSAAPSHPVKKPRPQQLLFWGSLVLGVTAGIASWTLDFANRSAQLVSVASLSAIMLLSLLVLLRLDSQWKKLITAADILIGFFLLGNFFYLIPNLWSLIVH